MGDIPTYSLLEKHDDLVSYRIPDTVRETPAWVRIGLFSWELEGVPLGRHLDPDASEEEIQRAVEKSDGVGIHIDLHPPNSHYPRTYGYKDRVSEVHNVFSRGSSGFRIMDADPAELRQTARWIALYAFSYWWWIDTHSDYPLGKYGTREQNSAPKIETVLEDGTVVVGEGEQYDSPYTLGDIQLLSPDEWLTPYERSVDAIQATVDELLNEFPETTVAEACRDVEDGIVSPVEKTEEKVIRDEMEQALRGDGIGFQTRLKLINEFDSLNELCEDLRRGGERVRSLPALGKSREEDIIDALVENGAWTPSEESPEA